MFRPVFNDQQFNNMKSESSVVIIAGLAAVIAVAVLRECAHAEDQQMPNGPALFAANCGLSHGSDGRSGERAPDIATRREVVSRPDLELIRIVENGFAGNGMPAFGYIGRQKVEAIVHYLRTLQGLDSTAVVPGDPIAGESTFFGKAQCSTCHMMRGRGGFMASDLSGYGLGRTPESVRSRIIYPDRDINGSKQIVIIVASGGMRTCGMIRAEDNFSLVLQTGDGSFHQFMKDLIAQVEYSGRTGMPRVYESRLSNKEIDDLVSYLVKSGTDEPTVHRDDDE